jgi:hypothetical protein
MYMCSLSEGKQQGLEWGGVSSAAQVSAHALS